MRSVFFYGKVVRKMVITTPTADMTRTTFTIVSNSWTKNRAVIDAMEKAMNNYIAANPDAKMRCSDWNVRQRSLHETLE